LLRARDPGPIRGDEREGRMMATDTKIHTGYVLTDDGSILAQIPDESNRWGFYLADDDQTWDGGIGVASSWEPLADDDARITDDDRERLQWVIDEAR
jgi:hypothetical protein